MPHSSASLPRKDGVSFAEANDRTPQPRPYLICAGRIRASLIRVLTLAATAAVATFLALAILTPDPPAHASSASVARGAELFANTGCVHCHGPARLGTERGPDITKVRKRLKAKAIATQIHDGGQSMPPFGDQLTQQDIANLVDFLRSKRK